MDEDDRGSEAPLGAPERVAKFDGRLEGCNLPLRDRPVGVLLCDRLEIHEGHEHALGKVVAGWHAVRQFEHRRHLTCREVPGENLCQLRPSQGLSVVLGASPKRPDAEAFLEVRKEAIEPPGQRSPSLAHHLRAAIGAIPGNDDAQCFPSSSKTESAVSKRECSDSLHAGRSLESVSQVSSRLISSYWWMMKLRFATAKGPFHFVGCQHPER